MSVAILVGPNRSRYSAHKEILIKKCPFFAKCLDSGMKEEHSNEIEFPDDTCLAFDLFFLWIYSREIPNADSHDRVAAALDAWVLADKFAMPGWQNTLIDGIMSFWRSSPMAPGHLAWLHDNAGQSSLLLMLGAKQLVWNLAHDPKPYENEWLEDLEDLLVNHECSPAKLLCSVTHEKGNRSVQPATQGCTYHVHLDGKRCRRSR